MTYSRRETMCAVAAVLAASLGLSVAACTPATTDDLPVGAAGSPPASSGGSGSSGSPAVTAGTGNAVGGDTGTAAGAPAQAGTGPIGTGGATASAGAPATGSGGTVAAGGAPAASGGSPPASGGSGGAAPAASGCNWVKGANNLWTMNPAVADKQVLFDGTDMSKWHRLNQPTTAAQWKVVAGGAMEVVPQATPTNIQSNAKFDDVCLHVEYWTPAYPSGPDIQKQGNSGVYLKSAYEMQVLDTSLLGPLYDGCGAVYKVKAPLVVACTAHETWNTYEIEFKGSVWNTAMPPAKTKNALFVQVALNGQLVQQNVTLNPAGGFTEAGIPDIAGPQPIALQDHRDYVKFRNIWATVPRY